MAKELSSGNDNQPGVPIALKVLVIVLGVALVGMLVLLIYSVVTKKDPEPYGAGAGATGAPVMVGEVPHLPLDLGPGARVRQSTIERGVLILVVETGAGDKVVLFDVKAGRVLSVLDLSAATPQPPE
ncbi:MAG: hypothetical protein EP340_04540 [Alphaproteobacteria bacterium]|nr:MAG: hypothetical protein EP340_04540 [Alphaproteobacteria bacterium]